MTYKVYGKSNCPFCVKATGLLESKGMEFEYIDVTQDKEALEFIKSKGATTVPQIYIYDDLVGGYQELVHYLDDM